MGISQETRPREFRMEGVSNLLGESNEDVPCYEHKRAEEAKARSELWQSVNHEIGTV